MEFYGKGFFTTGDRAGERSQDNDSFHVVPIQAFAMYRFDVAAERWSVPLVPYGRAGVGGWVWWTGPETGVKAGFSYGAGVQLLLDGFDPRLAREFDREVGVNNSFLYADWQAWNVDGFGAEGFDLSDDSILSFGLALEF